MRIVLHHNPKSGKGRAEEIAQRCHAVLSERGHTVISYQVGGLERLDREALLGVDALVVIGGDGSVRYQAAAAIQAGVPIYHAGTGNENLFAKHFGMSREPAEIARAVEQQRIQKVDVARVESDIMLLMVGTGCDAGVIKRLDQQRSKPIGHLAYVKPILAEGLQPSIRPLTVQVDGERVVDNACGQLIIANCPEYAIGINPAHKARVDDGKLDIMFMPARTSVVSAAWLGAAKARVAHKLSGSVMARGRSITVEWAATTGPAQIDGEYAADLSKKPGFCVRVDPGVLPVLLPADGRS